MENLLLTVDKLERQIILLTQKIEEEKKRRLSDVEGLYIMMSEIQKEIRVK